MSLTRIFLNFYSFITRTTEDFTLMHYFLFLFIQVKNVALLFWVLPVFEFFIVISETPPCILSLAMSWSANAFQLLTTCAKMIPFGNRLLLSKKFCANPWHFYVRLSQFYWGLGLLPLYYFILLFLLYCFCFVRLVFCFCAFVLFLCLICFFVLAI